MRLFTGSRRSLVTLFSVAIVAACLVAQPATAQVAQHSGSAAPAVALPSAPSVEAGNEATVSPVLATESAARAGVARAEVRTEARATAAQPSDNTMRWGIILLIALAAAVLIVALAD